MSNRRGRAGGLSAVRPTIEAFQVVRHPPTIGKESNELLDLDRYAPTVHVQLPQIPGQSDDNMGDQLGGWLPDTVTVWRQRRATHMGPDRLGTISRWQGTPHNLLLSLWWSGQWKSSVKQIRQLLTVICR
jgi:hypothetical protein